jgi:hypothetical protein
VCRAFFELLGIAVYAPGLLKMCSFGFARSDPESESRAGSSDYRDMRSSSGL